MKRYFCLGCAMWKDEKEFRVRKSGKRNKTCSKCILRSFEAENKRNQRGYYEH